MKKRFTKINSGDYQKIDDIFGGLRNLYNTHIYIYIINL